MHEIDPSKQQLLGKARVLEERLAKLKGPASKQEMVLENRDFASGRESILRSALDCILTIDVSGVILEFNPEAERTFGYDREEVLGTMMAEKIIPEWLRQQREHAHSGTQRPNWILKHHAYVTPYLFPCPRREPYQLIAIISNASLLRLQEPNNRSRECGLARPALSY